MSNENPEQSHVMLSRYRARYEECCAERDRTNAKIESLLKAREEANQRAEVARNEANGISKQIEEIRGTHTWLALKKEIGILARALGGR